MKEQQYSNHRKIYPLHHLLFYPALAFTTVTCAVMTQRDAGNSVLWTAIVALLIFIAALSLLLRQHYALGNQNRIIRLELRLRYYILTQKRLEVIEHHFTD